MSLGIWYTYVMMLFIISADRRELPQQSFFPDFGCDSPMCCTPRLGCVYRHNPCMEVSNLYI